MKVNVDALKCMVITFFFFHKGFVRKRHAVNTQSLSVTAQFYVFMHVFSIVG